MFLSLSTTIVLGLEDEFNRPYGELISLSIPGFVAFAAGTLPAGWLGDRWSRSGMMAIFFIGIGIATILTGFAQNTWQIAAGLGLIGIFASIYHPIGYSILVEGKDKVGRLLGVNGVFGNFGVAGAALVAAVLMDLVSWRVAFIVPGAAAFLVGIIYIWHIRKYPYEPRQKFQEIDIEPEIKLKNFKDLKLNTYEINLDKKIANELVNIEYNSTDSEGNIYICGVMEHIEEAGVHSGDSSCSIPPYSLSKKIIEE